MNPARRAAATVLAVALAWPLAAAEPPGAATPQAVVDRLHAAAKTNDLGELMACLAPDDRREMTVGLMAGVSMMVAFMGMAGDMATGMAEGITEGVTGEKPKPEDKAKLEKAQQEAKAKADAMQKKLEGILKKHHVDQMMSDSTPLPPEGPERSKALATMFKGVDDIALSKDLLAMLEEVGKAEGKGDEPPKPIDVPMGITDLKITGDTATAKAGDDTVDFVRVDGRWFLRAPHKDKGAAPGI